MRINQFLSEAGLGSRENKGDFGLKIVHPEYRCEKKYTAIVTVPKIDKSRKIEQVMRFFKCGTKLEKSKTLPAEIKLVGVEGDKAKFSIIIKKGRKSQIRKIFEKARMNVADLFRTRTENRKAGEFERGRKGRN